MNAWIVVRGESGKAIIKALLPSELQDITSFFVVGERSNITSVARTLLVNYQEPVAVLAETHSLDGGDVRTTMEELLQAVSGGEARSKVILCFPVVEAILFEAPDILTRIFPKVALNSILMFYKTQPRQALEFLFREGGGPSSLPKFLSSLTEEDVDRLRMIGPIRDLNHFLFEVLNLVGNWKGR
jgi:hypothetical protein